MHGVGGLWGALATGIFAAAAVNGVDGLIAGNGEVMINQIIAVAATIGYSLVVTAIILKALDMIPGLGLRASEPDEDQGLDLTLHGERGYVSDGAD